MQTLHDDKVKELILDAEIPCFVQFSAEWCAPCKTLTPLVRKVEKEYYGKINFFHMDVDHNPDTPVKYGIRGIPTLMIFKDGEVVATAVGSKSEKDLIDFIEGSL